MERFKSDEPKPDVKLDKAVYKTLSFLTGEAFWSILFKRVFVHWGFNDFVFKYVY